MTNIIDCKPGDVRIDMPVEVNLRMSVKISCCQNLNRENDDEKRRPYEAKGLGRL